MQMLIESLFLRNSCNGYERTQARNMLIKSFINVAMPPYYRFLIYLSTSSYEELMKHEWIVNLFKKGNLNMELVINQFKEANFQAMKDEIDQSMKDFLEKKNVFIEKVAQFEKKMNVLKKNSTTAQKAYFINEFQKHYKFSKEFINSVLWKSLNGSTDFDIDQNEFTN